MPGEGELFKESKQLLFQHSKPPFDIIIASMTSGEARLRVIICGAGLGGLVLAHRLLQLDVAKELSIVVLERDVADQARHQGVVIGLRQAAVDALCKAGLGDILYDLLIDPAEVVSVPKDLCIMHKNGQPLLQFKGAMLLSLNLPNEKPKIRCSLLDRAALRSAMAKRLPEGMIHWCSRVVRYEEQSGEDPVTVILESGRRISGDVLIGCDGARSLIRAQRAPALIPRHLGLWNIAGTAPIDFDNVPAELASSNLFQHARNGLCRTTSPDGVSMMSFVYASANKTHTLLWSFSMPNAVALSKNLLASKDGSVVLQGEALQKALVQICDEYLSPESGAAMLPLSTPTSRLLLGYEMTSIDSAVLNEQNVRSLQNENSRVTLLGDAAHKTTTQAGLGATAAFQDAMDLADALYLASSDNLVAVLKAYELRMLQRAKSAVGQSLGNTTLIHRKRGRLEFFLFMGFFRTIGGLLSALYWFRERVLGQRT